MLQAVRFEPDQQAVPIPFIRNRVDAAVVALCNRYDLWFHGAFLVAVMMMMMMMMVILQLLQLWLLAVHADGQRELGEVGVAGRGRGMVNISVNIGMHCRRCTCCHWYLLGCSVEQQRPVCVRVVSSFRHKLLLVVVLLCDVPSYCAFVWTHFCYCCCAIQSMTSRNHAVAVGVLEGRSRDGRHPTANKNPAGGHGAVEGDECRIMPGKRKGKN